MPRKEWTFDKAVRLSAAMGILTVPPPRETPGLQADIERRREAEELRTHEVYFLYSCNRIKIGTSKHHLRRVINEIAPYCPAPLHLIGAIRGGPIVEARTHKRFEAAWITAEWFGLAPELRAFLCEDETRAERLGDAEDHYRDWLRGELNNQRNSHAPTV